MIHSINYHLKNCNLNISKNIQSISYLQGIYALAASDLVNCMIKDAILLQRVPEKPASHEQIEKEIKSHLIGFGILATSLYTGSHTLGALSFLTYAKFSWKKEGKAKNISPSILWTGIGIEITKTLGKEIVKRVAKAVKKLALRIQNISLKIFQKIQSFAETSLKALKNSYKLCKGPLKISSFIAVGIFKMAKTAALISVRHPIISSVSLLGTSSVWILLKNKEVIIKSIQQPLKAISQISPLVNAVTHGSIFCFSLAISLISHSSEPVKFIAYHTAKIAWPLAIGMPKICVKTMSNCLSLARFILQINA